MRTQLLTFLLSSIFLIPSYAFAQGKSADQNKQITHDLMAILQLERFDRLPAVIHPQTDAKAFKDSMSEFVMQYDEETFTYVVTFYEDDEDGVAMSGTYNYEYAWPSDVEIDILVRNDTALTRAVRNRIELALHRAYDYAEHNEDGHMIWKYNGPECYRMIHLDVENYDLENHENEDVGTLQEITLQYECDRLNDRVGEFYPKSIEAKDKMYTGDE